MDFSFHYCFYCIFVLLGRFENVHATAVNEWLLLLAAFARLRVLFLSSPILTYPHLSSPFLTYPHLSSPILTYADVC